jgi:hypothetical protein
MPYSYRAARLPTIRLLLDDGSGLDFTDSAKTKRIAVSLLPATV